MPLGPVRTGGYPEVSGNDVLGGRGRPAPAGRSHCWAAAAAGASDGRVARRDDEAEPIARAGFAVLAATLENPPEKRPEISPK
jgi:hypothetical protein